MKNTLNLCGTVVLSAVQSNMESITPPLNANEVQRLLINIKMHISLRFSKGSHQLNLKDVLTMQRLAWNASHI